MLFFPPLLFDLRLFFCVLCDRETHWRWLETQSVGWRDARTTPSMLTWRCLQVRRGRQRVLRNLHLSCCDVHTSECKPDACCDSASFYLSPETLALDHNQIKQCCVTKNCREPSARCLILAFVCVHDYVGTFTPFGDVETDGEQ